MGLISFQRIIRPGMRSTFSLAVALRRFIGRVVVGVLILMGRLRWRLRGTWRCKIVGGRLIGV